MELIRKVKGKIKKALLKRSRKNRFYLLAYRWLWSGYMRLKYLWTLGRYGTMDNLVLLCAMGGQSSTDNIGPIYDAMRSDPAYSGYRFVWVFKRAEKFRSLKKDDPAVSIVEYDSAEHMIAMARAKYIFASSGLPNYYIKRKGQVYFQTWHGTPLKKIGCDIQVDGGAVFKPNEWRKKYRKDAREMSYLLAPSEYMVEKLTSAFDLKRLHRESILFRGGYPRNDVLFKFTEEDAAAIREKLGIPEGKKVVLYAPTFRDSDFKRGKGYYFETPVSFERLREALADECVILFRPHVVVAGKYDLSAFSGFVFNVAAYPNIAELYIISDLVITDYSSVIFDYGNLKRPMVYYIYDMEEYGSSIRGLYFPIEGLPGEIAATEDELIAAVLKQLHEFQYDEKYRAFNERFNPWDGPDSSKQLVERIIPKLEAGRE